VMDKEYNRHTLLIFIKSEEFPDEIKPNEFQCAEMFGKSIGALRIYDNGNIECYLEGNHQGKGYGPEILIAAKEYVIANGGEPFVMIKDNEGKDTDKAIRSAIKGGFECREWSRNNYYYYYPKEL